VAIIRQQLHIQEADAVVHLALEQLDRRHLLEDYLDIPNVEYRLARRTLLKGVALAALPLVTSLAAPSAARAAYQHTVMAGGCTSNADCTPLCAAECSPGGVASASCVTSGGGDGGGADGGGGGPATGICVCVCGGGSDGGGIDGMDG
jgi:hypothetical protein